MIHETLRAQTQKGIHQICTVYPSLSKMHQFKHMLQDYQVQQEL